MVQKRYVMTGVFLLCWCCTLLAQQLKLGSNPTSLTKSALLELSSTNQGMLFSRISDTTSINLSNPPDGMVIYFTPTKQLMIRINSAWTPIISGAVTATNAWSINGNTNGALKILGTHDAFDLPFYTNNAERMRISTAGNVAIGATSFDATNPEKLLINAGSTTSVNAIYAKGSINNYFQINIQNLGTGAKASTDIVATANNGTETTNFVDLGINGSGWQQSSQSPISTGLANDTYLLGAGNDLYIANNNATKSTIFLTGGTLASNEAMRITSAGNIAMGVTTTTAKLDVNGTYKVGAKGTVNKNEICFASTIIAGQNITAGTISILAIGGYSVGTTDLTFPIPTANAPTTTQATVAVSFGADLPTNVFVGSARVQNISGVYSVKLRLMNGSSTTATFPSATAVYFTIVEF